MRKPKLETASGRSESRNKEARMAYGEIKARSFPGPTGYVCLFRETGNGSLAGKARREYTGDPQRLAPCGGGESLNVEPQAYGGRKMQNLGQPDCHLISTSWETRSVAKAGLEVAIPVEDIYNTSNIIFLKSTDSKDMYCDKCVGMYRVVHGEAIE